MPGGSTLVNNIANALDGDNKKIPETYFWPQLLDDPNASNFFAALAYFILSYIRNTFTIITFSRKNITERPVASLFSLVMFMGTVVWIALFTIFVGIGQLLGLQHLLDTIGEKYYKGNSLCNWGFPDLLHGHEKDWQDGIHAIIDGTPAHPYPNVNNFSVRAARASLILSAVAYETWENFIKLVNSLNTPELYITQARELHTNKTFSFTRIIFIRDAVANQNLIFVIFRGTSPFRVAEWLTDSSMSKVPADRFLWGSCHSGFYSKLFLPLSENCNSVYRTILNDIKEMILKDVELDGTTHPYYLASTGHSLGAGYCHFFHARFLKAPGDLDWTLRASGVPEFKPNVKFIGSYTFGGPRGGNFEFYSQFLSASKNPLDKPITLWRCVDACDFIPNVVPGVDEPETAALTATNHPQDLLDYTHVGREVHLHRWKHEAVAPLPSRVGTWAGLFRWCVGGYEKNTDYIRDFITSWLSLPFQKDPQNFSSAIFPPMGDHAPANYWVNLGNAIEPVVDDTHNDDAN